MGRTITFKESIMSFSPYFPLHSITYYHVVFFGVSPHWKNQERHDKGNEGFGHGQVPGFFKESEVVIQPHKGLNFRT